MRVRGTSTIQTCALKLHAEALPATACPAARALPAMCPSGPAAADCPGRGRAGVEHSLVMLLTLGVCAIFWLRKHLRQSCIHSTVGQPGRNDSVQTRQGPWRPRAKRRQRNLMLMTMT